MRIEDVPKRLISGLTLAGYRTPGGIRSRKDGPVLMSDWPAEIELSGTTYTFEKVSYRSPEGYESAEYV